MLVCGVDDAGRGSVLGPLVIAGISIEKNKIKQLVKIGVKDSKQLSPQSREKLYKQILSIVDGIRGLFVPLPPYATQKRIESVIQENASALGSATAHIERVKDLKSSLVNQLISKNNV